MTITEFRRMLAEEIDATSKRQAADNGASSSRDFGEYRYHAGVSAGLMMAAVMVHNFLRDDEDDIDG